MLYTTTGRMTVNDEMEMFRKEAVPARYNVLCQHLSK
jgi:hypothetical protein